MALTFRLLAEEVAPALRRIVGPGLRTPEVVHLRSPAQAEPLLGSAVDATVTEDGLVTGVGVPVVAAAEDDELLRLLLVYQLARFHELAERQTTKLVIVEPSSGALWSAYYAHRVASASGLVSPARLLPSGLALPSAVEVAWLKALRDVDPAAIAHLTEADPGLAGFFDGLGSHELPGDLYLGFPRWSEEDRLTCSLLFSGVALLGMRREIEAAMRRQPGS